MGSNGPNACLHLPLLSAQHSSAADIPHAQIYAGDAAKIYTCEGIAMSEFGAVCGNWCALFHVYIFLQNLLPIPAPFLTLSACTEPEKSKLSNGVLRSGNGAVAAKFCLGPYLASSGKAWGDPMLRTTFKLFQMCPRLCLAYILPDIFQ